LKERRQERQVAEGKRVNSGASAYHRLNGVRGDGDQVKPEWLDLEGRGQIISDFGAPSGPFPLGCFRLLAEHGCTIGCGPAQSLVDRREHSLVVVVYDIELSA
jgi:hypothetical protein